MKFSTIAASAALAFAATSANATILVVFDDFDGGFAAFASTVTGAGGTQSNRVLVPGESGNPADFGDFTIARNNGGFLYIDSPYGLYSASPARQTTGGVININPQGPNTVPRANPLMYRNSGITFNFDSPINALGFEVGDWATCCQPSGLYIQFGNNTPIQVGNSVAFGDQFLTNRGAGVFVAAFDDSDDFTTVSFWGDGIGEFLVMGGTVRYALLDRDSLPPTNPIPEPGTWAMMILGFGVVGFAARRRRTTAVAA